MKTNTLTPLQFLNNLINDGVEYPDAIDHTVIKFSLTLNEADALQEQYDTQWT